MSVRLLLNLPISLRCNPRIGAEAANPCDHGRLDVAGRQPVTRARTCTLLLLPQTRIISVAPVAFDCIGMDHCDATRFAAEEAPQERAVSVSLFSVGDVVALEQVVHALPDLRVHDRLVLAVVDLALVPHLADVKRVGQRPVQQIFCDRLTWMFTATLGDPLLGGPAPGVDGLHGLDESAMLQVQLEHAPDSLGFIRVHHKASTTAVDVIAKHGDAPDPFSLSTRRAHFVASALGDNLPLELGEAQQDVQREPADGVGAVELLSNGDESYAALLERLHQAGEVHQRSAQPIHLVDDNAVDDPSLHVGQQAPLALFRSCWPRERRASLHRVQRKGGRSSPKVSVPVMRHSIIRERTAAMRAMLTTRV